MTQQGQQPQSYYHFRPIRWLILAYLIVLGGMLLLAIGLFEIARILTNPLGWLSIVTGLAFILSAAAVVIQTARWIWRAGKQFFS